MLLTIGVVCLLNASLAQAIQVSWAVDDTQSFVRLTIPDQTVSVDGTNVTARVRNANNSAWNDAGGRMARLGGTLESNVNPNNVRFTGGSNVVALEERVVRPDRNSWDPGLADGDNPDGQYSTTDTGTNAFGGKLRATALVFFTFDVAFIAFNDVVFDMLGDERALAGDHAGAFTGNLPVEVDSDLYVDGLFISTLSIGQLIPDIFALPVEFDGISTGGGTITDLGGNDRRLDYTVNVPISFEVEGVNVNANFQGQIVAFGVVPEPSSMVMFGLASMGIATVVYRRRKSRK